MPPPKLSAMRSMAQEGSIERHDVNVIVFVACAMDHVVALGMDCEAVGPIWQKDAGGVAHAIGWGIDVAQENVAACGKPAFDLVDHFTESLLERGDPWLSLFQRGPVHRTFDWRSSAVSVNQIVPARGHDNDPEHILVKSLDLLVDDSFMIKRN
ncbi:hypothetical protein SAMN06265222_11778 [Neorhodopirellula lusitana]|uniref:Uncharacterized protein n=1 Tax=Neorhodopirellula lusitana TaxID=445327 RepID=A0ABY1QL05_9BACT|nr:hypothetical protein SAMN06265222_11778 [Neorhodopirellula lusitana]